MSVRMTRIIPLIARDRPCALRHRRGPLVPTRSGRILDDDVPTIARIGPYRFFFYSGDRGEPRHVHVEREDMIAKFWLAGPSLAESKGFASHELRAIIRIIGERQVAFVEAWDEHFRS